MTPVLTPVRTRSSLSFGRGASHVEDLVIAAKASGCRALGLADRNTVAGHVRLVEACRKHGVLPIFGAEIAIATERRRVAASQTGWVGVLVQSPIGFRNLARLLAQVPLGGQDAIPLEALLDAQEDLLLLSGNREDGFLPRLLEAAPDQARKTLARLRDAFGDRFYIEIERHPQDERGSKTEAALLELAHDDKTPCPIIATAPIWYATPDRQTASRLLQASAKGQKLALAADGRLESPDSRERSIDLASASSLASLFADLPEALRNAADIAERCAYAPESRKPLLPALDLADETPDSALRAACRAGLEARLRAYPVDLPEKVYIERLDTELGIIRKTGFASYFLIVAEFVSWARAQDIPVGPGRGSGVGSLAAWALGITEIDPVRHGLLFERFLNPERVSLPDFDIDFCERRRGEVLQHVVERYGGDRVAAISTFAEIKLKSAIKDVARAVIHPDGTLLSFQDVNAFTQVLPSGPEEPRTVAEALERFPGLRQACEKDPRLADILRLAQDILGLYRQPGLHAAGVIIADRPLHELAAVHPVPDNKSGKLPQLGIDMRDAEKLGLVKFDFLGLSTTTLVQDATRILVETGHAAPDWPRLDRDDPAIMAAFAAGDTFGIFQFESAGMRSALKEVKPTRFSDLAAINALFRPGPIKHIQEFARRKAGKESFAFPAPAEKTEPILRDTYGIMVYQEQVMEMARICAGYSPGAADILRRAMGKKKPEEMARQKRIFLHGDGKDIPGALALGLSRQDAERLFEDMASFAGYGFNKSHAVAYSDLAWRAMWLKINHPEAFYCALLNIHLSDTEKLNAIREDMQARKIDMLPPDILRSQHVFVVERDNGRPAIRFGLGGIKNIGESQDFLQARKALSPCTARRLVELVARSFNGRQLESLAAAGAFDSLLENRRQAYEAILAFRNAAPSTTIMLAQDHDDWLQDVPPQIRNLPDWEDRHDRELRNTGMNFGLHPITANKDLLFQGGVRRLSSYLAYMRSKQRGTLSRVKLAFLPNGCALRTAGRSGTRMLAISAAEETDRYEVFVFEDPRAGRALSLEDLKTMLETARTLREPVVATVDISVDPKTGKAFVKAHDLTGLNAFALTVPGCYVATIEPGHAPLDRLLARPSGSDADGVHRLLVRWKDGERPPAMLEGVHAHDLAALLCRDGVELRRAS